MIQQIFALAGCATIGMNMVYIFCLQVLVPGCHESLLLHCMCSLDTSDIVVMVCVNPPYCVCTSCTSFVVLLLVKSVQLSSLGKLLCMKILVHTYENEVSHIWSGSSKFHFKNSQTKLGFLFYFHVTSQKKLFACTCIFKSIARETTGKELLNSQGPIWKCAPKFMHSTHSMQVPRHQYGCLTC